MFAPSNFQPSNLENNEGFFAAVFKIKNLLNPALDPLLSEGIEVVILDVDTNEWLIPPTETTRRNERKLVF